MAGAPAVSLPVRPDPPRPNAHGYTPTYNPSYGYVGGLQSRLADWIKRLGRDRSLPWAGLGLVKDLEITMQLLNLREFAEWLKIHGPAEHRDFGEAILRDQETIDAVSDALLHAGHNEDDPVKAIENLDGEVRTIDDIRAVLVEAGALEADDRKTPLPDLVRALLS